ncbi:MAG: class I SAM-dependent methyltransferase [Patescibacteria group bacterium]
MSNVDKNNEITLMNYGYSGKNSLLLERKTDLMNKYGLQLYDYIVNMVKLDGLNVLEIGSGRGGGAFYISNFLNPKSYIGMDICGKAINFCNKHYKKNNLSFIKGDALNLPFANNNFDAVINIESSHSYAGIDIFLKEVYRVLKPDGYFLFADFRYKKDFALLKNQIKNSKMKIIKEENITDNVIKALNLDNLRKVNLIKRLVPKLLYKPAQEFAGVKGSEVYDSFLNRDREYFSFILKKQ